MKIFSTRIFWIIVGFFLCLTILFVTRIIEHFFTSQSNWLSTIKNIGESLKPIVEIAAIVIAGLWSYRLFIKNRVEYPFAEIKHDISHWNLGNGKVYLSVIVTVKNVGNVLLELESGKIFIHQVKPLLSDLLNLIQMSDIQDLRESKVEGLFHDRGSKIAWRELGYREPHWEKGEVCIEPGEIEEFQYDFILDEAVQTIKVITYYRNIKAKIPTIGWRLTTLYDLEGDNDDPGENDSNAENG